MNAARTGDSAGFDELKQAISKGDRDVVKAALKDGFEVSSKDYLGRTLLMFAAEEGQTEIVKILIAAGAKLDTRDQMLIKAGAKMSKELGG